MGHVVYFKFNTIIFPGQFCDLDIYGKSSWFVYFSIKKLEYPETHEAMNISIITKLKAVIDKASNGLCRQQINMFTPNCQRN